MSSGNSGAVFFLGSRAHYQVLDQPESTLDSENGNTSTVSTYMNAGARDAPATSNWNNEPGDVTEVYEIEQQELGVGVKRRVARRQSEAALCGDQPRPAALNGAADRAPAAGGGAPAGGRSRGAALLGCVRALARRRRRLEPDQVQYLRHLDSALTACTYRESCRCFDCQSRYFECEDSDEYSSDDSEYIPRYSLQIGHEEQQDYEDSDDEVFINSIAGDNTSTDLLIEGKEKMSVSSDELDEQEETQLGAEVAAGTPIFLNYLLTHPITCAIQ